MNVAGSPIVLLIAEDDPDDQLLVREALEENRLANDIYFVNNGEELLDFLYHRGRYTTEDAPFPDLILLDLNMPKVDGRQALAIIKADPELHRIPIVVLTTSRAEEDVLRTYDLGVNSFIVKPVTFEALVHVTKMLTQYWFSIVRLPAREIAIELTGAHGTDRGGIVTDRPNPPYGGASIDVATN